MASAAGSVAKTAMTSIINAVNSGIIAKLASGVPNLNVPDFLNGIVACFGSSFLLPVNVDYSNATSYYAGRLVGELDAIRLFSNGLDIGGATVIAGLALDATGLGALAGIPLDAAGATVAVASWEITSHATFNAISDARNLEHYYFSEGLGNASKGTGELWHTPSVDNPNFASEQSLQSHFDKHVTQQGEFGNITEEQYISDAKKLVTSKPGGDILTYTRSNGDTLFYNKANNEFAVVTNKGVIRTFFKPANGIEYFNSQR